MIERKAHEVAPMLTPRMLRQHLRESDWPMEAEPRPVSPGEVEELRRRVFELSAENVRLREKVAEASQIFDLLAQHERERSARDRAAADRAAVVAARRPSRARRSAVAFWTWLYPQLGEPDAAPAKRCAHGRTEDVESSGAIVAVLCLECGDQLPAGWCGCAHEAVEQLECDRSRVLRWEDGMAVYPVRVRCSACGGVWWREEQRLSLLLL
ncbi:hypothetical protein ACQP25_44640 (plasmid) [Microtetraspora malaysiensis]|uniref:hypothetical protein n=1 Tax=Microtetraspora malaysiensis TaxID=161358 RepID=UPI003D8B898A